MKLSVALATISPDEGLKKCLDSITEIASEIVIYDASGSSEVSALTAKYKKVKLIKGKNHHLFHLNKQTAIDNCTGDWILQLDADEVVTPQLATEITRLISKNPSENGFWINRSNFFLGRFLKKGGVYPDPTIRLYRRGFGRLPCKDVHEQAEISGSVGHLKSDLLHYSDPTFSRYLIRNDRYTTLLAEDFNRQQVAINLLNFINYLIIKPIHWFILSFIIHKGFQDGFPGFVFAWYSSLRFPLAYIKLYEIQNRH